MLVVACCYPLVKPLMHEGGASSGFDVGTYVSIAWHLGSPDGNGFWTDVAAIGHMGEHFSPVTAVFALPMRWLPSAHWLMVAQGLAVGATLVLLAKLAKDVIGPPLVTVPGRRAWSVLLTLMLLGLFVTYPPLCGAFLVQFQPIVLGMPFVIGAILLMHRQPTRWTRVGLVLCVTMLLTTRESAPLTLLGLAIYGGGVLRRWRWSLWLGLLAGVMATLIFGLVMPLARGPGAWDHANRIGPFVDLVSKGQYLVALLGGVAFLPLLGKKALFATLAAVPGVLLNVSVQVSAQYEMESHYDAQLLVFLCVAAIHGLAWLIVFLNPSTGTRRGGPIFASVAAIVIVWAGVEFSGRSVFEMAHAWWPRGEQLKMVAEARRWNDLIPPDVTVAADDDILPYFVFRNKAVLLYAPRIYADHPDRLEPGDRLVARQSDGWNSINQRLERDDRARLTYWSPDMTVYEWLGGVE